VLRKPDYDSLRSTSSGACVSKKEVERSHDCATPVQAPHQSPSDTSTETPPDDTLTETPLDDTPTETVDDLTTPTEENILRQNRPKFVLIPHPRTFSPENQPPHTSSTLSSTSSSGSSHGKNPMTLFDQSYTRGSPASSNVAFTVEPGLSVLVVDDDPITRSLMKRLLTRLGCTVSVAENGEMALEMILSHQGLFGSTPSSDSSGSNSGPILERRQNLRADVIFEEGKYAVVFLDNQMPVMSGLKAVEKLRQLGRKDFIVGVTGSLFFFL
jgi:osomolarity two-component system sensor histidine kinase SLN1